MVINHLLNGMILQVVIKLQRYSDFWVISHMNGVIPITDPWDERYMYLHLPYQSTIHDVGKYTVHPMDP